MRWFETMLVTMVIAIVVDACSPSAPELKKPVGVSLEPVGEAAITAARVTEVEPAPPLDPQDAEDAICPDVLPSFVFETNSSAISSEQDAELQRVSWCLTVGRHRNASIGVIGRTDARGNPLHNLRLGRDRAVGVTALLVARGVSPERIVTTSAGALSTPANEPGRRVDLLLLKRPE